MHLSDDEGESEGESEGEGESGDVKALLYTDSYWLCFTNYAMAVSTFSDW